MVKKTIIYLLFNFLVLGLTSSVQASKKFYFYDAMSYAGKPDLSNEGLLPVYLMYEVSLTKQDPANQKGIVLDFDKVNDQVELASLFPGVMVSTDIEHWYYDSSVDDAEMAVRFDTLFNAFRARIPDVFIGNYGVAPSSLCVHRYYRPNTSEDSIMKSWRKNSKKRWIPLHYANVAQPSVYIAEPNIDSWIRDLKITVREIKQHEPDKKIIVYIWPQYYDKKDSPHYKRFIAPAIWKQMLEAVYENCDGAIIWSSRTDETDQVVRWSDSRVQANWKMTKEFISIHKKNLVKPQVIQDFIKPVTEIKPFKVYANLEYTQIPDLSVFGIKPIVVIDEKEISAGIIDKIHHPDSIKIASVAKEIAAKNPTIPVCVDAPSWIQDRMSNNEAMLSRFEMVSKVFKDNSKSNPLLFTQVSPTSLSSMRVNSSNFFTNLGGWKISAVNTTSNLSEFVDILLPASYAVDNDTITWKREFYLTIREARKVNRGKPVYAHFTTEYINNNENFDGAYTPVSESTWLCMLNAAYNLCDGVVFTNKIKMKWSDNFGFWKATQNFLKQKQLKRL